MAKKATETKKTIDIDALTHRRSRRGKAFGDPETRKRAIEMRAQHRLERGGIAPAHQITMLIVQRVLASGQPASGPILAPLRGVPTATVRGHLRVLARQGFLRRLGRGWYAVEKPISADALRPQDRARYAKLLSEAPGLSSMATPMPADLALALAPFIRPGDKPTNAEWIALREAAVRHGLGGGLTTDTNVAEAESEMDRYFL